MRALFCLVNLQALACYKNCYVPITDSVFVVDEHEPSEWRWSIHGGGGGGGAMYAVAFPPTRRRCCLIPTGSFYFTTVACTFIILPPLSQASVFSPVVLFSQAFCLCCGEKGNKDVNGTVGVCVSGVWETTLSSKPWIGFLVLLPLVSAGPFYPSPSVVLSLGKSTPYLPLMEAWH